MLSFSTNCYFDSNLPTIKRGEKVQTIIQKKLKFIDLRRIAKNNVDVLNRVLMADNFKGL